MEPRVLTRMRFDRPETGPRHRIAAVLFGAWLLVAAGCATGPRYQGMPPEALHALAQTEMDEGDEREAILVLDRLILTYPEYDRIAEARYLLGRAYFADEQYLLAADEYMRFLERHGGHLLAPEAALGVCLSYVQLSPIPARDQQYTGQAFGVCRDVEVQYAAHPVAAEAAALAVEMRDKLAQKDYDNAQHWYRRGAYDSAIVYWEMVLEAFPDTEWAPRSLLGIHCAWTEIGYDDDAEAARTRLLEEYPDSPEAAQARNGSLSC